MFVGAGLTLGIACSTNPDADGDEGSDGALGGAGGGASGGTNSANGGAPSGAGGGPSGGGSSANGGGSATGGGGASGGTSAGGAGDSGGAGNGAGGSASGACSRALLQAATDSLAAALESADPTQMALSSGATYEEQLAPSAFSQGIWQTSVEIAFQRDFFDVDTCETFSEIIVTESPQYVMGVRLTLTGTEISAVSALIEDENDWNLDADSYLNYSSAENWSVIPADERDTREGLIAAGTVYLDRLSNPDLDTEVPWGTPCQRIEHGSLNPDCTTDNPDNFVFTGRHWVVDRDLGTAIVTSLLLGSLPDSHMFRLVDGTIRYVHVITLQQ